MGAALVARVTSWHLLATYTSWWEKARAGVGAGQAGCIEPDPCLWTGTKSLAASETWWLDMPYQGEGSTFTINVSHLSCAHAFPSARRCGSTRGLAVRLLMAQDRHTWDPQQENTTALYLAADVVDVRGWLHNLPNSTPWPSEFPTARYLLALHNTGRVPMGVQCAVTLLTPNCLAALYLFLAIQFPLFIGCLLCADCCMGGTEQPPASWPPPGCCHLPATPFLACCCGQLLISSLRAPRENLVDWWRSQLLWTQAWYPAFDEGIKVRRDRLIWTFFKAALQFVYLHLLFGLLGLQCSLAGGWVESFWNFLGSKLTVTVFSLLVKPAFIWQSDYGRRVRHARRLAPLQQADPKQVPLLLCEPYQATPTALPCEPYQAGPLPPATTPHTWQGAGRRRLAAACDFFIAYCSFLVVVAVMIAVFYLFYILYTSYGCYLLLNGLAAPFLFNTLFYDAFWLLVYYYFYRFFGIVLPKHLYYAGFFGYPWYGQAAQSQSVRPVTPSSPRNGPRNGPRRPGRTRGPNRQQQQQRQTSPRKEHDYVPPSWASSGDNETALPEAADVLHITQCGWPGKLKKAPGRPSQREQAGNDQKSRTTTPLQRQNSGGGGGDSRKNGRSGRAGKTGRTGRRGADRDTRVQLSGHAHAPPPRAAGPAGMAMTTAPEHNGGQWPESQDRSSSSRPLRAQDRSGSIYMEQNRSSSRPLRAEQDRSTSSRPLRAQAPDTPSKNPLYSAWA